MRQVLFSLRNPDVFAFLETWRGHAAQVLLRPQVCKYSYVHTRTYIHISIHGLVSAALHYLDIFFSQFYRCEDKIMKKIFLHTYIHQVKMEGTIMWRYKYFFCGYSSIAPSRDWYAVQQCIMCVYMKPYYHYEVEQHSVSLKHFTSCDSKRYSASCVHTYVGWCLECHQKISFGGGEEPRSELAASTSSTTEWNTSNLLKERFP